MNRTELPAFVAKLESLEAKATPGPWIYSRDELGGYVFTGAEPTNKSIVFEVWINQGAEVQASTDSIFAITLRNHAPALLALVRQLQGENAALQIQASKYAYERDLAKRERDRAEARFHSLMTEGKITNG